MTLKSLHDSSYINCKSLKLYIYDDFFQSNILDVSQIDKEGGKIKGFIDEVHEIIELGEIKPNLYVNARENCSVNVMSSWDILKM